MAAQMTLDHLVVVRIYDREPVACGAMAAQSAVNRWVVGSNPTTPATPDSPQGGEAVCKTVALGMVGSIPTSGTWKYTLMENVKNIGEKGSLVR